MIFLYPLSLATMPRIPRKVRPKERLYWILSPGSFSPSLRGFSLSRDQVPFHRDWSAGQRKSDGRKGER